MKKIFAYKQAATTTKEGFFHFQLLYVTSAIWKIQQLNKYYT